MTGETSADPSPVPARHAATVLLLREVAGQLHVLMLRRHSNLTFMGGRWAFPGGGLSPHDSMPRALSRLRGAAEDQLQRILDLTLQPLDGQTARGLLVAACRETFEEAGVLLAQHADGTPCSPALVRALQGERARVDHDASLFAVVLEREDLYLDTRQLLYWSHWITPSGAGPRRYDTRFFLIPMPDEQDVTLSEESSEFAWMTPTDLIHAADRGEMPIPGPTLSNLQELDECHRRCGSLAELLASECARPVPPILPKVARTESGMIVVMPWDADYATIGGEGIEGTVEYSEFLQTRASRRIRR